MNKSIITHTVNYFIVQCAKCGECIRLDNAKLAKFDHMQDAVTAAENSAWIFDKTKTYALCTGCQKQLVADYFEEKESGKDSG